MQKVVAGKYQNFISRFNGIDSFSRNSLLVFLGSIIISFLNFAYYPMLARLLSVNEFGEVQTLVTVFTQLSMVLTATTSVAVILVAKKSVSKNDASFVYELQKIISYVFILFGLLLLVVSHSTRGFLQLSSIFPLISLLVGLGLNIPIAFSMSYLQGREDFKNWNILGIVGAILKIIIAAIFVYVGWGVTGAIISLSVSQILIIVYIHRIHKDSGVLRAYHKPNINWTVLYEYLPFALTVFAVSLTISIFYSADLILIKHYLSPEEAGLYSGVSILGRIIIFITSPFIVVLLPSINSRPFERLALLKKALFFVLLSGGACLGIFTLFAKKIVTLVAGSRYSVGSVYLPKMTILFLMIAALNILVYYQVSMKDKRTIIVCILGLVYLFLQIMNHHTSITEILNSLITAVAGMLLLMLINMSLLPRLMAKKY